jgi:energy-coupling factor transporter ATP-binding protein EcfA2
LTFNTYELFPKVNVKYGDLTRVLGNIFAIMYYRDEKLLHIYTKTLISAQTLRQYFGIQQSNIPSFKYYAEAVLKKENDFYSLHEFNDIQSFLSSLEVGQGMYIWFSLEPNLKEVHYWYLNKIQKFVQQGNEKHKYLAQAIREKLKDPLYLVRIILLDNCRKRLKLLSKQFDVYSSLRLSWEIPFFCSEKTIMKIINEPPRLSVIRAFLDEKKWIHITKSNMYQLLVIPDPSIVPINIGRGTPLPDIVPERPNGFRIGTTESGKEVKLEIEDLQRHMYVIGRTGAGKTTFIKTLLINFMKKYPNSVGVVIDPNGDFAEELATYYKDYDKLVYVDPVEATVAVNPLSIPKGLPKDQAFLLAESNVKEIFTQLFALKESAVYVNYIIINALKLLYMRTTSPTFSDLYNIIMKLRSGELDLPIDDPEWEEKLQQFQELEETTYISALSRLEEYATNPLLKRLFNSDSIDDVLQQGNIIVINASNAMIGSPASFLMIAGWIYKLWYSALIRASLRKERIPVLTIIDEFEVIGNLSILDVILSQARKFAMHLVLAHQHTEQLPSELLKSVLVNTAVKVLLGTEATDAEKLSKSDPDFSTEIANALPNLKPGEAILLVKPRNTEATVPFKVKIDMIETKRDINAVKEVIEKMKQKYWNREVGQTDITSIINPVLKYIEKPKILEQLILYYTYVSKGHIILMVDLLKKIGIDRDRVEDMINKLESLGYITTEKQGNKKVLVYGKGLFGDIKASAPSNEGRKLAMKVMLKYMKQGYYVAPAKQSSNLESRPDLVAIPIDRATLRPEYDRAIAIEIESCNEISTHPEQVVRNWRKESVKDFLEVHSWTYEECFDKLQQLYNQLSDVEKNKVKIFSLKIMKKTEEKQTGVKTFTGEFAKSEEPESIAQQAAQGAAVNNANSKLGSLTQSKNTTIEQQPSNKEALVEVEIEGKNYFVKRADYEKLQQILSTKNYKIEGDKIYAKIGPVRMEVLLISNRPSDSQGPRNP